MSQHEHTLDRRHWTLTVVGGMASLIDSASIVTLSVGLKLWKSAFEMNTWEVGVVSAALTFSIALGAMFGGRLSDKYGRVRVFNIDILITALGFTLIALAGHQWSLVAGLIIVGLGAGADLPTSLAVISERAPGGTQGRLVGFTQVMWSIGIIITYTMAFALSGMGLHGIRLINGFWAVVAFATWIYRAFSRSFKSLEVQLVNDAVAASSKSGETREKFSLREILSNGAFLVPLFLTGFFYISRNLLANSWGQFQTYFLTTVTNVEQSTATGIGTLLRIITLVIAIAFIFVADTKARNPMFYICGLVQIATLCLAAFSGGTVLWIFVLALVFYHLSGGFAGEGIYKVWTQESVPVETRATIQGISYSISRFVVGLFALVTPTIMAYSSNLFLWLLVGFACVAYVAGLGFIHYQKGKGIVSTTQKNAPANTTGQN